MKILSLIILFSIIIGNPNALAQETDEPLFRGCGESPLLYIDRYFSLENFGLVRAFVTVNGNTFKLSIYPQEVERSDNTYLMADTGFVALDILPYLFEESADFNQQDTSTYLNYASWCGIGPRETEADFIFGDVIFGETLDYLMNVSPLPDQIHLNQPYPNPFIDRLNITFNIAVQHEKGVYLTLSIYDMLGRRISQITTAKWYPGTFDFTWNGQNFSGQKVPAGAYWVVLQLPDKIISKKIIRLN